MRLPRSTRSQGPRNRLAAHRSDVSALHLHRTPLGQFHRARGHRVRGRVTKRRSCGRSRSSWTTYHGSLIRCSCNSKPKAVYISYSDDCARTQRTREVPQRGEIIGVFSLDILHLHCSGRRLVQDAHPKQCKCRMSISYFTTRDRPLFLKSGQRDLIIFILFRQRDWMFVHKQQNQIPTRIDKQHSQIRGHKQHKQSASHISEKCK